MIQITPHMKIYLCLESTDFRKGIDGLCSVCRHALGKDPFSGSLFIFRNKRCTTLKIIAYDGQGYWLFVKRLSKGRFKWWPDISDDSSAVLTAPQLQLLIYNGDVSSASIDSDWRRINQN